MNLGIGVTLDNRYRIESKLSYSDKGNSYRAKDLRLGIPCVVKWLYDVKLTKENAVSLLQRASVLATLRHPNLPRVTDFFGIKDTGMFLVTEYVYGENLFSQLKKSESGLPEVKVLDWVRKICETLEYLHTQNPPVVHRDIKPQNIIITPSDEVMLVNFNLSEANLFENGNPADIEHGTTPGFSPIEQSTHSLIDIRSDIYALGATLYTLLTNQIPPESINRLTNPHSLPPPSRFVPSINPFLDKAILKALEVVPENRPQTIRDFLSLLSEGETKSKIDYVEKVVNSPSILTASIEKFHPKNRTTAEGHPIYVIGNIG